MVIIANKHLIGAAVIIIILGFAGFLILSENSQKKDELSSTFDTPLGTVLINAILPESPVNITLYRVSLSENDMAFVSTNRLVKVRPNVTKEADAPQVVKVALLPYGGLPQDAKLTFVKTEYIETFDTSTHQVTAKHPITTNVQYRRYIDDKPVVGDGGSIYLNLGDYGELIFLNKVWRTVTPVENVSIIPVSAAIEKMKRGELLGHAPKCACPLNVDKIGLGYYEKGRDETQEYLEPVWIFSGTLSSGDSWNYYVYAREFDEPTPLTAQTLKEKIATPDLESGIEDSGNNSH